MAGYIRQSTASIINGSKITAPPLNNEFNKLEDAFNGATGHTHDGSTGNAQPIPLATSVSGYLPVVNGGVGGKNNTTATANPTTSDDLTQGYAPGSIWINENTGYTFLCLHNTENSANWVNVTTISNIGAGTIAPITTNTADIGTATLQFKDIHIDGTGYIDAVMGDTVSTTGDVTVGGALAVTGSSSFGDISSSNADIDGGSIDGTAIGAGTASSGAFAGLTATGNITFSGASVLDLGTVTTADIDGGSVDGVTLGTNSAVTEAQIDNININGDTISNTAVTSNLVLTPGLGGFVQIDSADINGGSIDGTSVGATTASTGAFTTLTASTSITGTLTGDVNGNIYASDTTSKILDSGTNGTNATFTGSVTGNVSGDVTSTGTSTFATLNIGTALSFNAGATATITNLIAPTNAGDAATKGYVDTAVSNLVDSAPGSLDTLNELAAALNDDASFSTTVTNSIAEKLPLAGGVMTGNINMTDATTTQHSIVGLADPTNAQDAATKAYADTKLALSGGTLTGAVAMSANKITGVANPTDPQDAATKAYVDNATNAGADAAQSATEAEGFRDQASNFASQASSDASSVANLYDSFDDRYLGPKSTPPSTDNDGDTLQSGTLYFDTTNNSMKVFTSGGTWIDAGSSVAGIMDRFKYVSTSNQTTFSGNDANGNSLAYDVNFVDVYLSGLRLVNGTDYTATSGTSIQLTTAPDTGSTVEIVAFGNFTLNNPSRIFPAHVELSAITRTNSDTAVDVFVYDTSKDSDGGAWRNRTQGTSWYNEALGTGTRGHNKKFPAVAVIVAEVGKITIYDADDPTMPMWMVFENGSDNSTGTNLYKFMVTGSINTVTMKDGLLCVGRASFIAVDFVGDRAQYGSNTNNGTFSGHTVSQRNEYGDITDGNWLYDGFVVQAPIQDIDITVLPDAPISSVTGLPVPTIALAADYGVCVIKDDGSVVDITASAWTLSSRKIMFLPDNKLLFSADNNAGSNNRIVYIEPIPHQDLTYTLAEWQNTPEAYRRIIFTVGGSWTGDHIVPMGNGGANQLTATEDTLYLANAKGLAIVQHDGEYNNFVDAIVTSEYRTGIIRSETEIIAFAGKETGDFTASGSATPVSNANFSQAVDLWNIGSGTLIQPNTSTSGISLTGGWNLGTLGISGATVYDHLTYNGSSGGYSSSTFNTPITVVAGRTYKLDLRMFVQSSQSNAQMFTVKPVFVQASNNALVVEGTDSPHTISVGNDAIDSQYLTIPGSYSGGDVKLRLTVAKTTSGVIVFDELAIWDQTDWTIEGNVDDMAGTGGSTEYSGINSSGQLQVYYADTTSRAYQDISLSVGQTYLMSFDLIGQSSGGLSSIKYAGVEFGSGFIVGSNTVSITPSVATGELSFEVGNTAGDYFIIDNITFSVIDQPNYAYDGAIGFSKQDPNIAHTLSLVESQTDIHSYRRKTGITGLNSVTLEQEPVPAIQNAIGIGRNSGAFTLSAWVRNEPGSSVTNLGSKNIAGFLRNADDGNNREGIKWGFNASSGQIRMRVSAHNGGTSNNSYSNATLFVDDREWHHYVWATSGNGQWQCYKDGEDMGIAAPYGHGFSSSTSFTNMQFTLANSSSSSISLGKTTLDLEMLSQEEVRASYNHEKDWYKPNNKGLIAGDDNIVRALVTDPYTGVTHVGTHDGRSEFVGSKRVGNTNDSVGTCISAVNGLVVEE